jgi:hypothetical protein
MSLVSIVPRALFRRARLLRKALARKHSSPQSPVSQFSFLVISPGGAGTTMLLKHLSRFASVQSPHDRDGWKHLPQVPSGIKVLFLYSEPLASARSLRRRGMLFSQSAKLGCVVCAFLPSILVEKLIQRTMRAQIERYLHAEMKEPGRILCIPYEQLWQRVVDISDFLGLEAKGFVEDFPVRKTRQSSTP